MQQLLSIGADETKAHLPDLLRKVRCGQGFTITQRGEPLADPAARRGSRAAGGQKCRAANAMLHGRGTAQWAMRH